MMAAQVATDYLFRCASENFREVTKAGGNAYSYVFDYVWHMAWLFPVFGLPDICNASACHSEEIPFVCGRAGTDQHRWAAHRHRG